MNRLFTPTSHILNFNAFELSVSKLDVIAPAEALIFPKILFINPLGEIK